MKEITKIELGRQAFIIALDAHKLLSKYLGDIKKQLGEDSSDLLNEVEMRIAELLSEKGLTDKKAILYKDIEHIIKQLGEPKIFKDEDSATAEEPDKSDETPRQLFRSRDRAIIAGVCSGLGNYTALSPWIFRIIFIILILSGGFGLLIYLMLWIIIPEAKTPRDYLRMQGRAVTIDNINALIKRAEFQSAAERAGKLALRGLDRFIALGIRMIGLGFILISFLLLMLGTSLGSYLLVNGVEIAQIKLFPINTQEHIIVVGSVLVMILSAVLLAATGRSIMLKRRIIPSWATSGIIADIVIAAAVSIGLALAAGPDIANRVDKYVHNDTRSLQAFDAVKLTKKNDLSFPIAYSTEADEYKVEIRTLGDIDPKLVKANVVNGELEIDVSKLPDVSKVCSFICPFGEQNIEINVYRPYSNPEPLKFINQTAN